MPNDEKLKEIEDFPYRARQPLAALPDPVIRPRQGHEPFFLDFFATYPVDCDSPKRYLFASSRKTSEITFVRSAHRIAANHLVTLPNEILYGAELIRKRNERIREILAALAKWFTSGCNGL